MSDGSLPRNAGADVAGTQAPVAGQPAGYRLGPIRFADGMSGLNAWTFLYVNLMVMPIVSFLSFSQPYVLSEIVGIPASEHGRLTGLLVTMQEVVALLLVGFIGGLSDRFGRRSLYAIGVLIAGLGFALYANADSRLDLFAYRFVYAVGVAFIGVMIAVTAADYPHESSRGKLAGATGLLNGLGVGLATLLVAALPAWFMSRGMDSAQAGQYMLYAMSGICVVTAIILQIGLKGGTPTGRPQRANLLRTLRIGLGQARSNPRIAVCFAGSFIARADLTLVATFVSLWLQQAARNEGMTGEEAIARAGIMFALIQGTSLLFAPVAGVLLDRVHRLACVMMALGLAAAGYVFLGLQTHPFGPAGYLGCVLVGMGQISVILSVTALLGQETPMDVRGSVIGLAGLCGAAGILLTSLAGGYLFDHWMISAPVVLTGVINLAVFIAALMLWLRDGRPTRFDPAEARSGDQVGFGAH